MENLPAGKNPLLRTNLPDPNPQIKRSRLHRLLSWVAITIGICVVVLILLFAAVITWPAFGAQGADFLRGFIGDKAVAGLEM
jgi:uncharacterized membrane protein